MLEDSLTKQFDSMLPYMKEKFPNIIADILKRAKKIDESSFTEQNFIEIQSVNNDAKIFCN